MGERIEPVRRTETLNSFHRLEDEAVTSDTWSKFATHVPFCEPSSDVGTKEASMGSNDPVSTALPDQQARSIVPVR